VGRWRRCPRRLRRAGCGLAERWWSCWLLLFRGHRRRHPQPPEPPPGRRHATVPAASARRWLPHRLGRPGGRSDGVRRLRREGGRGEGVVCEVCETRDEKRRRLCSLPSHASEHFQCVSIVQGTETSLGGDWSTRMRGPGRGERHVAAPAATAAKAMVPRNQIAFLGRRPCRVHPPGRACNPAQT
jgi:hypothetical protein